MIQVFRPRRIAIAFVLSFVLLLNVSQMIQAKTSHIEQQPTYPSQTEAQNAVQYYYNIIGPFSQKNILSQADSVTYGPIYGTGTFDRFNACVQYRFVPQQSKPGESTQIARHTFTFQYEPERIRDNQGWQVIRMDENTTC